MQHLQKQLSVTWRGKTFLLQMNEGANLKDLGDRLQQLTNVKADTMRLIVPANKGSNLLYPFSNEHSNLPLEAASTFEGKSIRMMGVPENEIEEVLESAKKDLRIAGFDEEEKRTRQRTSYGHNSSIQLPQGPYIFSEFQTLSIPGVKLNPPASEALKLMHRLAADPGIVAIMNKHRWQVGIMTEMAPVGYVGVSPKCILGFNKNHGEEISLRLRTDDLKGFRKYESIKKTLLHELAHMVYSEHDADFYALDKQLNKEAAALDWTKSKGHTLNPVGSAVHYEEEYGKHASLSRKLGGQESGFSSARTSSVAAAFRRFADTSSNIVSELVVNEESEHDSLVAGRKNEVDLKDAGNAMEFFPVLDSHEHEVEHHPLVNESREAVESAESQSTIHHGHDYSEGLETEGSQLDASRTMGGLHISGTMEILGNLDQPKVNLVEPDPDDSLAEETYMKYKQMAPHQEDSEFRPSSQEPDPDDSQANVVVESVLEPNDNRMLTDGGSTDQVDELDPADKELQSVQDPVTAVYSRLQKAIDMLRSEVDPLSAAAVLQTLLQIIWNVIEHPNEMKFRKLRKANATIQRNILRYAAAKEILNVIGFSEEVVLDGMGNETHLVLKRDDPGLLWLVKSSLESYNALPELLQTTCSVTDGCKT